MHTRQTRQINSFLERTYKNTNNNLHYANEMTCNCNPLLPPKKNDFPNVRYHFWNVRLSPAVVLSRMVLDGIVSSPSGTCLRETCSGTKYCSRCNSPNPGKNKDWNGYNGELDIAICFCNRNRFNVFAHLSIEILWDEN